MKTQYDVAILGGGLAGLTAAIHLRKQRFSVVLIEKSHFPKHKVCGEYISNEILDYFNHLGIALANLKPTNITHLHFSLQSGQEIKLKLPLGGFGISRYVLDYHLYNYAKSLGVETIQDTIEKVFLKDQTFTTKTKKYYFTSKIALGAFGKRSNLDIELNRNFIKKKSNWIGIKAHYHTNFDPNLVGLHHFKGGYCGVSKVENSVVNICYLVNYSVFKNYNNIKDFEQNAIKQNKQLQSIFEKAKPLMQKPLSISQISFNKKEAVKNNILMVGDSAGLIHPLCGNGMAMAIHSAKLASDEITHYLNGTCTRKQLETNYSNKWNSNFKTRLAFGRLISAILRKESLAKIILGLVTKFPVLLQLIIRNTHGKPIQIND